EVIEALAPLERRAGSEGERRAAEWIAARLRAAGARHARVEETTFLDGYAPLIGALCASAAAAGVAALASPRARVPAAAAAFAAAAAIADDVSNGPRVARRAAQRPKPTQNVVAEVGDPAADGTLVVMAHHDAAPTGLFFDQSGQEWFGRRFPGLLERLDTTFPNWWLTLAGPLLVGLGAARGRRGLVRAGTISSAASAAVLADIARSPIVPGANDNLTAVAVQVALAERLRERPVEGLRVLLVSLGAEEVCQGGIYGFGERHFPQLDRERTWFLNVETVGSPHLVLMEGEGTVVMEDYRDAGFRDLVARVADRAGVPLRRGMRWRNSTDAVIPNRAGFRIATIASVNGYKAMSNYHLMSDTPENVDYGTVAQAVTVTEELARALA
ncbi:MAG: M28 family peptidase, partial [Thermoleophilaceae bacterium]|nr:M28 family peptidase [Thermoleophilaceae bacterium]